MIVTGYGTTQEINATAVFPNPATTNLNLIGISSDLIKLISIYSSTGQLIKNIEFDKSINTIKLDISFLSPGMYFLSVDLFNENKRFKFVVSHDEY